MFLLLIFLLLNVSWKSAPESLVRLPWSEFGDAIATTGVDSILGGHTHGGQVLLSLPSFMDGSRALRAN